MCVVHSSKARILAFGLVLQKARKFVSKYRKSNSKAMLKTFGFPRRLIMFVDNRW